MATNLAIWSSLFACQLFLLTLVPHHAPGDAALGMGLVYVFGSIFHALEPETELFRYPSRAAFLAFVVAFGWEIAAPLAHGAATRYAVLGPVYLGVVTAPCWLLNWRFPSAKPDRGRTNRVDR